MPTDFGAVGGNSPEGALIGLRVLVVDDQPETVELMDVMLRLSGATVQAVGSVREALEAVQSWRPDVVLSDLDLPEENGYQFIAKVRLAPGLNALPVIAVTAHGDDRARALAAGFTAFVPKPVDFEELVSALQVGRRSLPAVEVARVEMRSPSEERPPALCERVPDSSTTPSGSR
jgi:CheY-like chemotaxis protein